MIKKPEFKSYNFTCSYKEGKSPCNGNHYIELNNDFYVSLIYRLIFGHNKLTVNKEIILSIIEKCEKFFADKIAEHKADPTIFNHYSSIDIEAEIMHCFIETEFGEIPNNTYDN